jgi:hypothetical protein
MIRWICRRIFRMSIAGRRIRKARTDRVRRWPGRRIANSAGEWGVYPLNDEAAVVVGGQVPTKKGAAVTTIFEIPLKAASLGVACRLGLSGRRHTG